MYGWRARVGLILPSLNVTMEPELNRLAPEGVSIHATRALLERGTRENLEQMVQDAERAALLLATAKVDVIAYGCTSGSLIKGVGWDRQIAKSLENQTGIPATTTSTAVIEAFAELGVGRVAVCTPYIDEVNAIEKKFFEDHGIEVVNIKGLGYTEGEDLHREPPWTAYRLAKEVNSDRAECVFISCTDFKSIEILSMLEKDIGKPVMSSNTATMWAILRLLGIKEKITGYGEILTRL